MKSLKFLLLALSFCAFENAFSEKIIKTGITYEIKSVVVVGAPVDNVDSLSRSWYINIVSNIVGNSYKQFYHLDTIKFDFLKTDSQEAIHQKMVQAAQDFIRNTYK